MFILPAINFFHVAQTRDLLTSQNPILRQLFRAAQLCVFCIICTDLLTYRFFSFFPFANFPFVHV